MAVSLYGEQQSTWGAAAGLAADPLFQLSTAGQELFHTNMLFWLATEHPAESRPVWDLLGVDAPTGAESSRSSSANGVISTL